MYFIRPHARALVRLAALVLPIVLVAVSVRGTHATEAAVIGRAVVTADSAPILDKERVIATARKGDVLEVVQVSGEWYMVKPALGWVNRKNLTYTPAGDTTSQGLTPAPSKPSVEATLGPKEIAARVFPSVVLLVMQDANGQALCMGSGFFVLKDVVATNRHVIEGASKGYAKVVGQKTQYALDGIVGMDEEKDLVLLGIKQASATPLPLGATEGIAVGERVYAVGNPYGLEGTMSEGIISGLRTAGAMQLFQISAPISPGNSGGPVLDTRGQVIGIAVGTFKEGQNLNFAIPASYLKTCLSNIGGCVPFPGAGKGRNKSALDDIGKRSLEGVGASHFEFASDSFTFSLNNELQNSVRNIKYLVLFYDENDATAAGAAYDRARAAYDNAARVAADLASQSTAAKAAAREAAANRDAGSRGPLAQLTGPMWDKIRASNEDKAEATREAAADLAAKATAAKAALAKAAANRDAKAAAAKAVAERAFQSPAAPARPFHFEAGSFAGPIPPGLGKRVSCPIDDSYFVFYTVGKGGRVEVRVIDFEIAH
jgi:S1-C subfamily serine protease